MKERNWTRAGLLSWIYCFYLVLPTTSSPVTSITHCEILEHANITCFWTAVGLESTSYTLWVNKTNCENNSMIVGFCNTTHTQCSVTIGSLSHCFCVDVLAWSPFTSTRSPRHCFKGVYAVKMYPPEITALTAVPGKPDCLKLEWKDHTSKYVQSEKGLRVLQIESSTSHQAPTWSVNTLLHDWQINLCGLHPGTKYSVRVRAQDKRAAQHWSSWSSVTEATTAEAAPAAALELWRHIQSMDRNGQRRITLLWKPLQWPDSNGVILRYALSCWNDLNSANWSCSSLDSSSTSCVISVSANPCTCNLTASNLAGTSPPAQVYIPGDEDAVLPPPQRITVTPLDDFQMKVEWKHAVSQSEASFVLEWFPIPNNTATGLYWKILNGMARSFIIADNGIFPEVPYNISVRLFCNKAFGDARFDMAFSRQGAPSVGPTLEVLQKARNLVSLRWRAVPLEKLRGFLQNYTVLFKTNGKIESQVVNVEQITLSHLSPGEYTFCVKAYTVAGGAEGPWVAVAVRNHYIPVIAIGMSVIVFLLIVVILLCQVERFQQCFCPSIPDPSKSSLATLSALSLCQNKLTPLDFKTSPTFLETIHVGGISSHRDHYNNKHSQVWALTHHAIPSNPFSNKNRSMILSTPLTAKADQLMAEQTFNEPGNEKATGDLTIDLSYKSSIMTKPTCWLQPDLSSSCSVVSDYYQGLDAANPGFCKRHLIPGFEPCYSCTPVSKSFHRLDTLDPGDHLYETNLSSKLKSCCNNHFSTSHLPDVKPHFEYRLLAKNSTNLLCKSLCLKSRASSSYIPVPSLDDDYITVKTAKSCPSGKAYGYVHMSTSYIPVPLDSEMKDSTNLINNSISGSNLCCYNQIESRYLRSCPDFILEDFYRPLENDECPQISTQKH